MSWECPDVEFMARCSAKGELYGIHTESVWMPYIGMLITKKGESAPMRGSRRGLMQQPLCRGTPRQHLAPSPRSSGGRNPGRVHPAPTDMGFPSWIFCGRFV